MTVIRVDQMHDAILNAALDSGVGDLWELAESTLENLALAAPEDLTRLADAWDARPASHCAEAVFRQCAKELRDAITRPQN